MLRNAVTPEMADLLETGSAGDIDFYSQYARHAGGSVLALLCGTGRIAIAVARMGVPVLGLDADTANIRLARRKAETVGVSSALFVQGDPTHFVSDSKYSVVMIAAGAIQKLLTLEEQRACLISARSALHAGGQLLLDIPILTPSDLQETSPVFRRCGTLGSGTAVIRRQVRYDSARQIREALIACEWLDDAGTVQSTQYGVQSTRYATPGEMILILESCGFQVTAYGGFDRQDLVPGACRLVVEAQRQR